MDPAINLTLSLIWSTLLIVAFMFVQVSVLSKRRLVRRPAKKFPLITTDPIRLLVIGEDEATSSDSDGSDSAVSEEVNSSDSDRLD